LGQKVHPVGFRLGSYRRWHSYWFARKNYSDLLLEDQKIRKFIKNEKELQGAGIATVDIERAANKVKIKIHTSRPGIVIGQKGRKIEEAAEISQKMILDALDGLPEESVHCALLTSNTLKEAIKDYLHSKGIDPRKDRVKG